VGIHDAPPYASFEDGEPVGFAVDVLDAIAASKGWELEYVGGTWDEQLAAATRNEIDLLVPVDAGQRKSTGLTYSEESLMTSWGQVFAPGARGFDNVTELAGARIAVVQEDAFGREFVGRLDRFDIRYELVEYADLTKAFAGVESGAADAVAVERLAGGVEAPKFSLEKTPIIFHPTAASFAAHSSAGQAALSTIDVELRAQKADSGSAYNQAVERWFDPQREGSVPEWIYWLLGALGGGLLLSLSVVRLSRRRVNIATEDIRAKNRELESVIRGRQRAEEQLRRVHKMEAVGHLASGLAHDFNNLLTVIYGHADRMSHAEDDLALEASEAIRDATTRAGRITRQLLAMASKQSLSLERVDPSKMLEALQPLLAGALRDDIRLVIELEEDVHSIEVDRGQLEQVLLSLAVNAQDAMPEGGELCISTRMIDVPAERGMPNTGPHVEIRVEDTGVGMDEDTRARVFDPFFTTKSKAKSESTGLGLAVAYGIVRQCRGEIVAEGRSGEGSRFSIVLPAASQAANTRTAPTRRRPKPAGPVAAQAATILFVDDDEQVRQVMARALQHAGMNVLTAESGERALEIARGRRDISVIVTDIVMSGMRGTELVKALRQSKIEAPVLYISGYAADDLPVLGRDDQLLQKPFTVGELEARVRRILDAAPRPGTERSTTRAAPEFFGDQEVLPMGKVTQG
jgi:signal transduction histidine kinase